MSEEYSILATLRYDPNLTDLKEIDFEDRYLDPITCLTVNNELNLNWIEGYKWDSQLVGENTKDFTVFQQEFSELNKVNAPLKHLSSQLIEDNLQRQLPIRDFYLSRFLFLSQHLDRINMTLKYFHNPKSSIMLQEFENLLIDTVCTENKSYEEILEDIKKGDDNQIYKIRVLINKKGQLRAEKHPLPSPTFTNDSRPLNCSDYLIKVLLSGFDEKSDKVWDIVIDPQPLKSTTPFTTFKTTYRPHYTLARERMVEIISKYRYPSKDSTHCEILVHNENNEIMEGSISNIAIKKGNTWVTPPLSSGCLCGIFRFFLLQKGYIQEGNIQLDEISIGDTVLIFNGVMGCIKAIIRQ